MAEDKITPEEKLLKIIEGRAQEKRIVQPAKKAAGHLAGDLMAWLKKIRIDKDALKKFDLKWVNKIAASLCGVFTVFLIVDLMQGSVMTGRRFERLKEEAVSSVAQEAALPSLDGEINRILSPAAGRNIFGSMPARAKTQAASSDAAELRADIKLVGIIWSDNPQAMLEDAKEEKTYLLSVGDNVAGLSVKKIMRDRVVMTNGQEEWELR